MTITDTTTVAEIASALPASVRVFQRYGIDFCCGGKTPLAVACEQQGLAFADVASAIDASAEAVAEERDWSGEPLPALIDHIVSTYHDALREELPRLESMANRVLRVHGPVAPHLTRLAAIVAELSSDLRMHMRKEELVLFPAIRTIATGSAAGLPIAMPITAMEDEHDHAGTLMSELEIITDGYTAPTWACETYRALYHGLAEFVSTMHVHVHLENNVLFPRALACAAAG